jgi:polyisoprenoid-binding protein YceI
MKTLAISTVMVMTAIAVMQGQVNAEGKQSKTEPQLSGTFSVKIDQSSVEWMARKVVGSSHHGTVNIKSGSLLMKDGKLTGGRFDVDMSSISNKDLTNETLNAKLVGHLKSDDFFSVQKFPVATFTISKAEYISTAAGSDPNYTITGDMRIKGITNKMTFPARIDINDGKITAVAKIVVDRSKFDVRYGSGSFFDNLGDNMIDDNFTLNLNMTAMK